MDFNQEGPVCQNSGKLHRRCSMAGFQPWQHRQVARGREGERSLTIAIWAAKPVALMSVCVCVCVCVTTPAAPVHGSSEDSRAVPVKLHTTDLPTVTNQCVQTPERERERDRERERETEREREREREMNCAYITVSGLCKGPVTHRL